MSMQLAPEVLSLLETVLADNQSALHKIAGMTARRSYDAPLSAGEPFLSKEERHLIRWHREEIGRLLFEGCMLTLQGPVEKTKTILHHRVTEEADWRQRIGRVVESGTGAWPAERDVLRDVRPGQGLGSRAARMAVALWPTDDARYVLADLTRFEGDLGGGRRVAAEIVTNGVIRGCRASAFTVLGFCAHNAGDHAQALAHYRDATVEDPRVSTAFANWFLQALVLGDSKEALAASERLRDNEDLVQPYAKGYLDALKSTPGLGGSLRHKQTLMEIQRAPIGELERRIVDALV